EYGMANWLGLCRRGRRSDSNVSGRFFSVQCGGGKLGDQLAGVAILCHPHNFRAPKPMRLHPNERFFSFAPQQAGDMKIEPGEAYISRYRFVVFEGPADKAELESFSNAGARGNPRQLSSTSSPWISRTDSTVTVPFSSNPFL